MALHLRIAFCLELILIITYPFAQTNNRLVIYLLYSTASSIVIASIGQYGSMQSILITLGRIYLVVIVVIFWAISVLSIIYAIIKLCRPGISQELRILVVKRHIVTVITFVISNLYI